MRAEVGIATHVAACSRTRTCHRTLIVLAFVGMFGHGVRFAYADTGMVVVGGSADEHARRTAGTAIEAVAREVGWSLETKQFSKKESDALFACKDPKLFACLPSSIGTSGIRHVLVVTVDTGKSDAGTVQLVIVGKLISTSPQDFAFNRHYCDDACAGDRLQEESTKLAQELLHQSATQSGRTALGIKSDPAGATVTLDGHAIGITDNTFNTFPGKHVVLLQKPGFDSVTKDISVEDGKTAEVSATLHASATAPKLVPTPSPSHVGSIVVGSAGLAALVAGVVLVVVDQDPSPSGGKQYRDTAPAGYAIGAAGIIAVGVGLYLYHRESHESQPSSAPTATLVRDGAVVGWSGRF